MSKFNHHMMILARDARGITQAELADRMKLGQGTVSKYETGFQEPPEEFVRELGYVLNFPSAFFLRAGAAVWLAAVSLSTTKEACSQVSRPHCRGDEYKANASFEATCVICMENKHFHS
jgi:hypothetical protein